MSKYWSQFSNDEISSMHGADFDIDDPEYDVEEPELDEEQEEDEDL